jgi:acylphosphatase
MKNISLRIYGKVQSVYFRASTRDKAIVLNITGFVRNEKDGSVFIEAEGTSDSLDIFFEWCQHGPRHATVSKIIKEDGTLKMYSGFEIR